MKKVLVFMLALLLVFPNSAKANTGTDNNSKKSEEAFFQIANEEKLIEMLRSSGRIKEGASYDEIEAVLRGFLANKSKQYSKDGELSRQNERREAIFKEKTEKFSIDQGKGKKFGQTITGINSVIEEEFDGEVVEDRILAILINFPDYDGSTLTNEHTDLLYDEYTKEHYADLLFGSSYEGPNGEDFISMKSYYEEQSGGAYTVTGKVAGWYTASQPAAYYGGNNSNDNDGNPRQLVYEALIQASNDPSIDLTWFDQEDRYDLDGDGNYREPDGLVDHIMIFHASVGEEAGGGELGADAVWSHRWDLGGVAPLTQQSNSDNWGGTMSAYDYTIQPIDAAAGVCAHEYGHDLGLADEYDTAYSGKGEPVSSWSIMSSGSWAGQISGTQPTGFSPYAKQYFAATISPRWFDAAYVDLSDFDGQTELYLDQAATKGENFDAVRIDIPNKVVQIVDKLDDNGFYYSTSGNELENYLVTNIDLSNVTQSTLTFDINYKIEKDWDYGYVYVYGPNGFSLLEGNITTEDNPEGQNLGSGITGNSNGWVKAEFDLSAFAGQEVELGFIYKTDLYVEDYGMCLDNIVITADGQEILNDSTQSGFITYGFISDGTGQIESSRYYLVEWRNDIGTDEGLSNIRIVNNTMTYDSGMLVWFVDNGFEDNHVGNHPGEGYLGVVDASQHVLKWPGKDGVASTRYQIHDAAFNVSNSSKLDLDFRALFGKKMFIKDNDTQANPLFDDSLSYINTKQPDAGRILPNYGLKIRVLGQSDDQTVGLIRITSEGIIPEAQNEVYSNGTHSNQNTEFSRLNN